MAVMDNAAAVSFLKRRFHEPKIRNLSFRGGPALAMTPKKTDFGGEDLKVPLSYAVSPDT